MTTARWFTYDGEFTGEGADLPYDEPEVLVLDGLVNKTAYQAYSLRRLRADYSGPAIKVRRSTDSVTLDVGFADDGTLDTATLLAFIGANNGFVETWYDQSGNSRHMVQTVTGRQPGIVASGAVRLMNGVPGVDFSATFGTNNFLRHTSPGLATLVADEGFTVSAVHVDFANGTDYAESAQSAAGFVAFNWNSGTPPAVRTAVFSGGTFTAGYPQWTTNAVGETHADLLTKTTAAGGVLYRDGLTVDSKPSWAPTIPAATGAVLGGLETNVDFLSLPYDDKIGEHIIFDGVLDGPSITALAASQVAYFGITI